MEEVAAICHAVIVELASRPSLGKDLKMIAIRQPTARHTVRALAHTQASLLWPV